MTKSVWALCVRDTITGERLLCLPSYVSCDDDGDIGCVSAEDNYMDMAEPYPVDDSVGGVAGFVRTSDLLIHIQIPDDAFSN